MRSALCAASTDAFYLRPTESHEGASTPQKAARPAAGANGDSSDGTAGKKRKAAGANGNGAGAAVPAAPAPAWFTAAVGRLAHAVSLHCVLPRTSLTPLLRARALSSSEVAYAQVERSHSFPPSSFILFLERSH